MIPLPQSPEYTESPAFITANGFTNFLSLKKMYLFIVRA